MLLVLLAALCMASELPRLEPLTGLPPHPSDNPGTPEKIELGRMLFFETMLSGARGRSCSTCHKPQILFMDGLSRAWGLHDAELRRRTPGLMNVGWQRTLLADGRAKTLEEQVAFPLKDHLEMDMAPDEAAERVAADPLYRARFEEVFPGQPITFDLIAKAIAAFERTLVSGDSDVDRYLLGDETALSPAAKRGMDLFTGKGTCVSCHHGPLLTDHKFHFTGVPESSGGAKPGMKYKTPSLRDVGRRYSYMHNGHYLRLDHVLDHYAQGGAVPEGFKSEVPPISFSAEERADLLAFLRSLNGRVPDLTAGSPPSRDIFGARPAPPPANPKGRLDPSYVNK